VRVRATVVLVSLAAAVAAGSGGAATRAAVECEADPGGAVQVRPSAGVAARFLRGTAWCRTSVGTRLGLEAPNVDRITAGDGLFGVRVVDGGTIVKVSRGFAVVQAGAGTRLVGPGQEVVVQRGAGPGEPQPLSLRPEDRELTAKLEPGFPAPRYPSPETVAATLAVGYVSPLDAATLEFVRGLFGFVADRWQTRLRLVPVPPDAIGETLASQRVGVLVTRGAASVGTPALPLATDDAGTSYTAAFPRGSTLADPLRGFLRTALEQGRYADFYRSAYGRGPSYTAFRALVLERAEQPTTTTPPTTTEPATGTPHPTTGFALAPVLTIGAVLLLFGAFLLRLARRPS
jgi:hypothetical protein